MDGDPRLRSIPSVNDVVNHPLMTEVVAETPRTLVVQAIRYAIDQLRHQLSSQQSPPITSNRIETITWIKAYTKQRLEPSLRHVINATGVLIHTNLGRAPLPECALAAISRTARGYCNLEFELATGERGLRHKHVEQHLNALTGAEASLIVNNNAAAVLLILDTLAKDKEVVVARSELVEIGGGFRVPEVMRRSGATLREVGTTNKTYLTDFKEALTPATALLMKIHQSNFRILGFTHEPSLHELALLAHQHNLPLVFDLGSGLMTELSGADEEMTPRMAIEHGADLVCFSADKMLGGPQAGIIVGSAALIEQLQRNQLMRALRTCKLTLAALESVLRLHRNPEQAAQEIPVLAMLHDSAVAVQRRAKRLAARLNRVAADRYVCDVIPTHARTGGGAWPLAQIPSFAVRIRSALCTPHHLMQLLRAAEPPIIAMTREDATLLDLRTVFSRDLPKIEAFFRLHFPSES